MSLAHQKQRHNSIRSDRTVNRTNRNGHIEHKIRKEKKEKIQVNSPDVTKWRILTISPNPGKKKEEEIRIKMCWMLCSHLKSSAFRIRAVFCVSGQHAVLGGWADDHCRLLQHRQRRMETDISDEGEEDGVWGCGNKWLYLCNWGILLLERDVSAEHWEIRPSAGLLGDCWDSAQSGQITWMCLCFQCLVLNRYHKCCHSVPNGSISDLYSVKVSKMSGILQDDVLAHVLHWIIAFTHKKNCEYNDFKLRGLALSIFVYPWVFLFW